MESVTISITAKYEGSGKICFDGGLFKKIKHRMKEQVE